MNRQLRLREVRKAQGLTVAELARRTNLHPTTLFDLEAGRRFPYPKYRGLLAEALGVSADLLFGEPAAPGSESVRAQESNSAERRARRQDES